MAESFHYIKQAAFCVVVHGGLYGRRRCRGGVGKSIKPTTIASLSLSRRIKHTYRIAIFVYTIKILVLVHKTYIIYFSLSFSLLCAVTVRWTPRNTRAAQSVAIWRNRSSHPPYFLYVNKEIYSHSLIHRHAHTHVFIHMYRQEFLLVELSIRFSLFFPYRRSVRRHHRPVFRRRCDGWIVGGVGGFVYSERPFGVRLRVCVRCLSASFFGRYITFTFVSRCLCSSDSDGADFLSILHKVLTYLR